MATSLTNEQFAAAQRLDALVAYSDYVTYSDLSAADRELLAAYRCEEAAAFAFAAEAAFDAQIAQIENLSVNDTEKAKMVSEVEHARNTEHQVNSYIGRIGHFMEPVMRPLGFDWKISVSLLSGMAAKEIVISTMGVLYTGDSEDQQSLQTRLLSETHADGTPVFSPLVVIGFLLFILIYFPCIATIVAIKEESHSWRWALFSVVYSTGLAWFVAFLVYQVGSLVG